MCVMEFNSLKITMSEGVTELQLGPCKCEQLTSRGWARGLSKASETNIFNSQHDRFERRSDFHHELCKMHSQCFDSGRRVVK